MESETFASWSPLPAVRGVRRFLRGARGISTPLWATGAGLVLVSVVQLAYRRDSSSLFLLSAIVGWFALVRSSPKAAYGALKRLAIEYGRDSCPVQVKINVDGKTVGEDDGIVTFNNGCLNYTGFQTSFRLKRSDVVAQPGASMGRPPPDPDGKWHQFAKLADRAASGFALAQLPSCEVHFSGIQLWEHPSIYRDLYDWLEDAPEGEGATVLPPQGLLSTPVLPAD